MYSTTPYLDLDSHNAPLTHTGPARDEHEPPAPLESWSLADFADIVAGAQA